MLTTFGFLDAPELVIILVIALVIFGPGKLPELGKSLGRGISEFKKATDGKTTETKTAETNATETKTTETKDEQSEK